MRTRDAKYFHNPDGTYLGVFGHNLHYESVPGYWDDVDLNFRPAGAGQVMDRADVVVSTGADGISVTDRSTGRGITWVTAERPRASGRLAQVAQQGLVWDYETASTGVKATATVNVRRGPQRYEFVYRFVGEHRADFVVNDRGDLVGDGFVVPRATVAGADQSSASPGPWLVLGSGRVGFEFDDSVLGDAAFPYQIDPTTMFPSTADDGWGVTGYSSTYPPTAGSEVRHPFQAGNDYLPSGGTNGRVTCISACYATTTGLQRWDTSALPDDAILLSAYVGGNIGTVNNANSQELFYSWQTWAPAGNEDFYPPPSAFNGPNSFRLGNLYPNRYNEIGFGGSNPTGGVSKAGYTEMKYIVGGTTPTGSNGFTYTAPPTLKVNYDPGPSGELTRGGGGGSGTKNLGCGSNNVTKDPVTTSTGNFWHTFTDVSVPGRGPALNLERSYNASAALIDSPFGYGWSSTYAMSAAVDVAGVVTVTQENGAQLVFTPSGGTYTHPAYVTSTLVHNADGTYALTRNARDILNFSATGQLISERDLNGETTTVAYNGASQIATVTDAAGRALTVTYGANGKIATITDPAGRQLSYGYDGAANLVDVTDVAGGNTHFSYDAAHRMLTMRDPRGGTVTNVYDSVGRVQSQTDAMNRTTAFDYTSVYASTKITRPAGNVELDTFRAGLVESHTVGYGTAQAAKWQREYDAITFGCTKITDPNFRTLIRTYDAAGNVLTSTDGLNRKTTFTYDALNNVKTVNDATNVTTTFTYDTAGNLTGRSRPLVGTSPLQTQSSTFAHADAAHPGDVTSVTDADAKVWPFVYDSAGNLTRATDPVGNATAFGYDTIGRRTSAVSARGTAVGVAAGCTPPALGCTKYVYSYNASPALPLAPSPGGTVTVTDPLGHVTVRHFDRNGNPDSSTDANGQTTTSVFNAEDEMTTLNRADGTSVGTDYDANGNVTAQRDGANKATTYGYDTADRVISSTDPLLRQTTFGYDGAGNRTTVVDPEGRTTTSTYDAADQLKTVRYAGGAPNVTATLYDNQGQRTSMTDGTGTSTWAWDSLGRMTQSKNGAGQVVDYTYDLRNHLKTIAVVGTPTVTRGYDDAGRWTSVNDGRGHTSTFGYDPDGNLNAQTSANGVNATNTFDDADQLTTQTNTNGAATLSSFSYGRDNVGQLSSSTATGVGQPDQTYGYTPLNQLSSVNADNYTYDPADNLTKQATGATLSYDTANQATSLTKDGATSTITYDPRGNRTATTPPSGPGTAYHYDRANRLTGVGDSSPETNTATTKGSVAVGDAHGLAIKTDGTVWAWGDNSAGQLGNGTTRWYSGQVKVTGLTGVVAVAAGNNHSLAVKSDGTVWAWGAGGSGQLGNGNTSSTSTPAQVTGLTGVVAIAASGTQSFAVKSDGTVWAWGANYYGQLGNGTTTSTSTPVQVTGLTGVVTVAAGDYHSLAVKSDGTAWAWGYNAYGQLGNGTTTLSTTPVLVVGLAGVVSVAAGLIHSAAVKSDGTVWVWGSNDSGQLGASYSYATTPRSSVALPLFGVTGVTAVAAGNHHTLALKSDGTVSAWGLGNSGQLGNGGNTSTAAPTTVAGLTGVSSLAAGTNHSLASKTDGTVRGWGSNMYGQLGDGTTVDRSTPVALQAAPSSTYTYDGDSLRASKTTTGATTAFAWDVAEGLPLLLMEGTTSYVYGPGGRPLERIDASGNVLYYHHDQLGSTRMLTDSAGNVAATYTFDAYGRPASSTGSVTQPFGYAGEYTDAETGFQYLRARYYDPTTAQFLTRDPIVALTRSPYGYVDGNPLNLNDPSGLTYTCFKDSSGQWVCRNDPFESAVRFLSPIHTAKCVFATSAEADARSGGDCGVTVLGAIATVALPPEVTAIAGVLDLIADKAKAPPMESSTGGPAFTCMKAVGDTSPCLPPRPSSRIPCDFMGPLSDEQRTRQVP